MNSQETFSKIVEVIASGETFNHYLARKESAEWNYSMLEGENQDEYVLRYRTKETQEQREQRLNVYNSRTPLVSKRVMSIFDFVEQADNHYESFEIKKGTRVDDFQYSLKHINGNGLLKYTHEAVKRLNFYDPNAFLLINQVDDEFAIKELYSESVIAYNYKNNKLEWIVFKTSETKYWIYSDSVAISCKKIEEGDQVINPIVIKDKEGYHVGEFSVTETRLDLDACPCVQIGYILDPKTKWKTFISPLQKAKRIYDDLIRDKNNYDLAKTVHAFLKKYAYVPECNHKLKTDDRLMKCTNGYYENGDICRACNGTGMQIHYSEQDVILLKMKSLDDVGNLGNLVHYERIPIDIIESYRDDIDKWEHDIMKMIFNSDTFSQDQFAETATQKILDTQAYHSKFVEFGNTIQRVYKKQVEILAEVHGVKTAIEHSFSFSNDWKIESVDDLTSLRGKAVTVELPPYLIEMIDFKILTKMSQGDVKLVKEIQAREKFRPFKYMTEADKALVLSMIDTLSNDYLMFVHYNKVMDKAFELKPNFANLKDDEQKRVVEQVLEEIKRNELSNTIEETEPIESKTNIGT